MQQKLNIFQLNVKLFNISGVIPSENIISSLWKSALFRILQAMSLLLFICLYTLQFLAIYHYWGNINLMTECIAFLAVFAGFCFFYFLYYHLLEKHLWRNWYFWNEFCFLQRIGQIKSKTYENLEWDLESGTHL